ncbi:MAG: hypothetical protein M1819_006993 [Sarea resinae]|nr:MAG: hypothetical protein M1819_006993 [Sarea resinae]
MPKKGNSGRGGGPKKPAPASLSKVDDSFIVFGNDNDKPKKTRSGASKESVEQDVPSRPKAKGSTEGSQNAAEDVPKKPDTRKLIGGASWTGKLPVNMLSEHCQKQRWEKPEYTMSKTPEGFSSMVILKATNNKTRETTTLPPFKLPPTHKHLAIQPTAVEARHFAATYALFRVCSMRNIHMMLPPNYRDLWKGEFQELKKEDVKDGKSWMYEADPFAAKKEREDAHAEMAKKREEREKQRAKEAESGSLGRGHGNSGGIRDKGLRRAPKIEMGKRTRNVIEEIIRKHVIWNPHGVTMPQHQQQRIVRDLSVLGFRESHVQEAAEQCKDREETLEWLLVHVPEDDLPGWALPEGYVAGISMASGDIKREASVKRLAAAGYATELCEKLFDACDGDEGRAAEALQDILLHSSREPSAKRIKPDVEATGEDERETWDQERMAIEAIFGDRFHGLSPDIYQLKLEVQRSDKSFLLQVRKPSGPYPAVSPIISVQSESLPAYIRLSIIRQSVQHAEADLLGEQMVFNMVDWLENEIANIIERPGKLRDVSSAASTVGEAGGDHVARPSNKQRRKFMKPIDWRLGTDASLKILAAWEQRSKTAAQQKMLAARQSLPAWSLKEEIVDAVESHQVTIISGETGSGKSTQAVQFVLDDLIMRKLGGAVNIICTQPRRISALGLADRVSEERCLPVGDEVGYAIRGESKQKPGITKITFVTTGVLLRRLQTSGGSTDDVVAALADVSHVVVDEVHERSLDTDFLLVLLRDVLKKRKDLKVILMSATLDADVFARYFGGAGKVGLIEIQGRTFPVEDYYLDDVIGMTGFRPRLDGRRGRYEDTSESPNSSIATAIQNTGMRINYDLIAQTVQSIDTDLASTDGSILIFLPGTLEINRTLDALRALPNIYPLPLHASLLPVEQRRVFPPAPKGLRKVIAATNVAETSITIQDVVAVIDSGRVKETSFDPATSMVKLDEVWASKAACKQRRGRAGRVRKGKCYKLFTRNAELTKMADRPEPEIRRVPLEQLCLSVKAMGIADVSSFLASALTPPETTAIQSAMTLLARMGALEASTEDLTALGRHLATIPADLRCGKLMVYGATFGCLEACITIAGILTVKSPFVSPREKREESKAARCSFGKGGQGDLIADMSAYDEWASFRAKGVSQREIRSWCDEHFLSYQTCVDISSNRAQYLSSLKEAGFIPLTYQSSPSTSSSASSSIYNSHNTSLPLIRALVAASFHPQISRIVLPPKKFAASVSGAVALDPEARTIKYFDLDSSSTDGPRVFIHPSSTLFDAQGFSSVLGTQDGGTGEGAREGGYLAWFSKVKTGKVWVREVTRKSTPPVRSSWG